MPRVASLYLPQLAIDRLRAIEARAGKRPEAPADPHPPFTRSSSPNAVRPEPVEGPVRGPAPGLRQAQPERTEDGLIPNRSGGWRPGARWAQSPDAPEGSDPWLERRIAKKRAKRDELQAQIDQLPAHQRPAMRELGRRSEPAPMPFKAMPPDEGARAPRPPYNLEGAFWQQGAIMTRAVAEGMSRDRGSTHGHMPRTIAPLSPSHHPPFTVRFEQSREPATNAPLRLCSNRTVVEEETGPLVTAQKHGNKILVAAACPAAQALGLTPGMALTHARALVPGLDVRDADPAGDAAFLDRFADYAARRWSPAVMATGDGLWLDLTGTAHLFGGEAKTCARIRRFCARLGLSARIAVAETGRAANAMARHLPGPVTLLEPGREAEALAPLPLTCLGDEEHVTDAARRLGIDTVGDLMALPRGPLTRRFGRTLLRHLDQALGHRPEPLCPVIPTDAAEAEVRFLEPIATAEAIEEAIRHAMALLMAELAARGLGARAVTMLCRRVDGGDQVAGIGTARATRDAAHLLRLMRMRIEGIDPGFGIEAIRLVAIRSDPLGAQAIGGLVDDRPDLAPLVDQLAGRLGPRRLFRRAAVESDVPERSTTRITPLAEGAAWSTNWPRPVTLLRRPEPVANVLAELPDRPPKRFTWRGQPHRVTRGDGPERIYGEWWRGRREADAVRDYFRVEDDQGARFWLFRRGDGADGRTGDMSWHLHGLFG
ncbi:DUF6504 family protein [Sphingomonas sp. ID0503]|uniref:Y-family DNA polymerase n=1 Tax=Sphingomonas sp. ID0503 TaxID=3399691 RepID=UPI003AFA9F8C